MYNAKMNEKKKIMTKKWGENETESSVFMKCQGKIYSFRGRFKRYQWGGTERLVLY